MMPDGSPWPCISIVTPSYNRVAYLEETIRSTLLQGYPNLEFYVIDGGSQDGSVEIIRKYERWLAGWVSEPDEGENPAINKGLPRCSGEIMTFHNSDDFYLPDVFADVACLWSYNQDCGVVAGAFYYVDGSKMRAAPVLPALPHEGPIDLVITVEPWRLHQVSLFFARHALDAVGRKLREDLIYNADREILYRVCRNFRTVLSETPYAAFRWHAGGKSISNMFKADMEYADLHLSYHYEDAEKDRLKRIVANRRRAKGHQRFARMHGAGFDSLRAWLKAPVYHPSLMWRLSYYDTGLRALGIK